MRQRGLVKSIGLVLVAVAVCSAVGYVLLQPSEGWPDESRRVMHPDGGFSIVQPKGFETHLSFATSGGSDQIAFLSTSQVGNPSSFTARHPATPPDPSDLAKHGYASVTFQGQPAWERQSKVEKTRELTRSVIVQRDGRWYEVYAHLPFGQPPDQGAWAAYFDSFRAFVPRQTPNLAAIGPAPAPASRP